MDEGFLAETLTRTVGPDDATIAMSIVRVGFSRTASDLGFTPGRVRHRFFRTISELERRSYSQYDWGAYTCASYLKSVAEKAKSLN